MWYSLHLEELENNGKMEFQDAVEALGIVSPSIESVEYCPDTMAWEFELCDGSTAWGQSPALAALDWLTEYLPIEALDERTKTLTGLGFEDYYLVALRSASGEFAA